MNIHDKGLLVHRNKHIAISLDIHIYRIDRERNAYLLNKMICISVFMHVRVYECSLGRASLIFFYELAAYVKRSCLYDW